MALPGDAPSAALEAYRLTLEMGADRETALGVALAKLRASFPTATEWELRSVLAKSLAAERRRTAQGETVH
jgi:hypothetical protein